MRHIKPLPSELQKIAESELGEVPERIPSDLQLFRLWIEQQPHLNARLDEQFLIQFLRGCKYNLEKAKAKIDLFFTLKTKFPEFCNITNVVSERFRELNNYGLCTPLPIPLYDNGPRILLLKYSDAVAKGLVSLEFELYPIMNTMQEITIMDDPYACINGLVFLFDLSNFTMSMTAQVTPTFLSKIVQFLEKSLPIRIKGVHFIKAPAFFSGVINLLMPLLSEKIRQRITVSGQNYESVYEKIPQKYFPIYMGGENGDLDQIRQDYDKKWLEYESYFKENINYGTNELLRPGKPIDFDTIFGMGGTFRKLDVD